MTRKRTLLIIAAALVAAAMAGGAAAAASSGDETPSLDPAPAARAAIDTDASVAPGAEAATSTEDDDRNEATEVDEPNDLDIPITGPDLDRATAAALDFVGEGRVTETEVEDEESYYEVEVALDGGRQIDVQFDRDFNVVGTDRPTTTRPSRSEDLRDRSRPGAAPWSPWPCTAQDRRWHLLVVRPWRSTYDRGSVEDWGTG